MVTRSRGDAPLKRVDFQGSWEEWDILGSGFSDFTMNQSYAWGEGRKADGWSVSRDLWLGESGEVAGMATALRMRVRGVRLLYISRGPVVFRNGISPEVVEAGFEACISGYRASLRWGEVFVCVVYPSPGQISPDAIRESGLLPLFPASGEYDFSAIVHLKERDSLLQGASSNWRKLFRRSKALLDEVRSSDGTAMFLNARDLVAQLEEKKGFTTTLTPALIRAVARTRARLFYLESESGQMVAALLIALCGRRASRFLAGVAPGEARKHPGIGRVLEVAASRWAFDSGVYEYDLEGIGLRNPGVSDFKKGMRGHMFAISGTHVVSRPAILAQAYSALKRRQWSQARDIWRISKTYFGQLYLRRLSGRRLVWEGLRLYRRNLAEKLPAQQRPGYTLVCMDRFDRSAFEYRLSTVRHLWPRLLRLEPEVLEFCAVIDKEGLAAAYAFLAWKRAIIPEIDSEVPLKDGEVYIMDGYVLPEHRGQRLHSYMLDQICARLRRRGFRAALGAVNPANIPPRRNIERAGFVPAQDARFRKIGRWSSVRWTPPTRPE